jgi:Heavy metal associated domain 2
MSAGLMPDRPRALLCHVTPRRVRLRLPDHRHDRDFFTRVEGELSHWRSIARVEANPVTAGVLIHLADTFDAFEAEAQERGVFALEAPQSLSSPAAASPVETVRDGVRQLDAWLRTITGGPDLRSLVFFALLTGGLYQFFRGNIAAPAVTMLWYAGETLRPPWGDGPPDAAGTRP